MTILDLTTELLQMQGETIGLLPMQTAFDADKLVREALARALGICADAMERGDISPHEMRSIAAQMVEP